MENPKTMYEKLDAVANLVEQMMLAHRVRDEERFASAHKRAGDLLFEVLEEMAHGFV